MVFIMSYEELVIQVMDKIVHLANTQVSRKMWYQVKHACPDNPKYIDKRRGSRGGYFRYHPALVTVVLHVLRELGFKIRKTSYGRYRRSSYYFLLDLEDLMKS